MATKDSSEDFDEDCDGEYDEDYYNPAPIVLQPYYRIYHSLLPVGMARSASNMECMLRVGLMTSRPTTIRPHHITVYSNARVVPKGFLQKFRSVESIDLSNWYWKDGAGGGDRIEGNTN